MHMVNYKDTLTFLKRRNGSKSLNFNYDSFLPDVITRAMNATLILKSPFTIDFQIEQITNADLSINGRSYSICSYKDIGVEPTITLRRDDICVMVPYKRFRSMADSISRTLTPSVWISTFLVIFPVSICLYAISKLKRHSAWKHIILFDLFRYYLVQTSPNPPKKLAPRLILAFWLLYSVSMMSISQSALYKGLTLEGRDPQIRNVSDLLKSNFQLLVTNVFYKSVGEFINNSSLKNHLNVVSLLNYLDLVESNNINYAYVARSRGTNHFVNIQMDDHSLPVYYTMKPCVIPFMTMYFVRQGSPFLKRINFVLRQTEENGLLKYCEQQLFNDYTKGKQQRLFHRSTSGCLDNLLFMFQFWSYGISICTVVFMMELIAVKIKRKFQMLFKR